MNNAITVYCTLLIAIHSIAVSAQGVVSARAVALSFGGTAAANSRATSDGQGPAKSTVVSIADKNSRAIGEAFAESKDGADASATLITRATDGATVDAKTGAIGEEEGAKAIVNSTASAKGDVVLESVAISEAINRGDGELINRVLERAYADSEILGDKISKVIKMTIIKATSQKTGGIEVVSASFYKALTSNPLNAAKFSNILASIITEQGCSSLKPYLTKVQDEASKQGTDDFIVSAIHEESVLAQCTYPTCAETEFCCAKSMADIHLCELCPMTDICGYVAYGNGVYSILKSASPYTAAKLCACPN